MLFLFFPVTGENWLLSFTTKHEYPACKLKTHWNERAADEGGLLLRVSNLHLPCTETKSSPAAFSGG